MNKEKYQKDLTDIQEAINKVKTLNESLCFEDSFDDMENDVPAQEEMPQEEEPMADTCADGKCNLDKVNPEDEGMKELENDGELDTIREITLKGMIALNKNPESPKFQALLRIFNICNKAVTEETNNEEQKN